MTVSWVLPCFPVCRLPLIAHPHSCRSGFARFTNTRFSMAREDIANSYVHLTNVAVQKHAPGFDRDRGCKWPIRSLRLYLTTCHGTGGAADSTTPVAAAAHAQGARASQGAHMMHHSHAAANRSKTHHAAATHAHAYTHAQAQMPQTNFLEQFRV